MAKTHPIPRETGPAKRSRAAEDTAPKGIRRAARQRETPPGLAEAMREQGLDERALATVYIGVLDRFLQRGNAKGSEKTLVDLIKEIARVLQPVPVAKGVAAAKAKSDGEVIVRLLHDIPRPVRNRIGEAIEVPTAEKAGAE